MINPIYNIMYNQTGNGNDLKRVPQPALDKIMHAPAIKWKQPAIPRHVIQMFVLDKEGRLLLMHRSNKVRSAKNVWSIPSGEHELGETAFDCGSRELEEEYGLSVLCRAYLVGTVNQ